MPTFSGGGGRYTPPTDRQAGTGLPVTIANGGNAHLTWDNNTGPDTLLDRSVPSAPTVLVSGIYAVSIITTGQTALTVGGSYQAEIELAGNTDDVNVLSDSAPAGTGENPPQVGLSITWFITAGDTLLVTVRNHDGAAARDFGLSSWTVQRIT